MKPILPSARILLIRLARLAAAGAVPVTIVMVAAWLVIGWSARDLVFENPDELALADVAIVPGALVAPDGRLSAALRDRVEAASALHESGIVGHLLVSGDNSSALYNEPAAMRNHAIGLGVPAEDITLDYAGVDTWDTCLRAHEQFGVTDAVLVTQQRYASRAAALCEAAGITISVLAIDHWPLPNGPSVRNFIGRLREPLAKVKAVGDLIRKPDPKFGGNYIGLVGSAGMPEGGHPPDWDWDNNKPG